MAITPTAAKTCRVCGVEKPLDDFHRSSWCKRDGRRAHCRPCVARRNKENYDPARRQDAMLKHRYGISRDDYLAMLAEQDFCCAICKTDRPYPNRGSETFCVDHCHATGRVRGLLCNACNIAVGFMEKSALSPDEILDYIGRR